MRTPFFKTVIAIIRKDLQAEFRSRELVSSMGLFSLLSIMIFSFALQLDNVARQTVIAGVLWVTVVFAVILGLNRSLAMERDQGNLDAMLLAPIDRATIYFGKMIGNFLFVLVIGVILLPVMTILFNVTLVNLGVVLVLVLGTLGLSIVGTLLSTMTVQTRTRETLLPIVMLPVALPVLLSAVTASTGILDGQQMSEWLPWVQLLAFIDFIYAVLCYLMFDYVVEE
jgi:heme exporter protein B